MLNLDSQDVYGAIIWPVTQHQIRNNHVQSEKWDGTTPVILFEDGLVILEWKMIKAYTFNSAFNSSVAGY